MDKTPLVARLWYFVLVCTWVWLKWIRYTCFWHLPIQFSLERVKFDTIWWLQLLGTCEAFSAGRSGSCRHNSTTDLVVLTASNRYIYTQTSSTPSVGPVFIVRRGIHDMWSQSRDTGISQCCAPCKVENSIPCHRAGYEINIVHTPAVEILSTRKNI